MRSSPATVPTTQTLFQAESNITRKISPRYKQRALASRSVRGRGQRDAGLKVKPGDAARGAGLPCPGAGGGGECGSL